MLDIHDIETPKLQAERGKVAPFFANPAQERFWESKAPELLYSGAMGAGKSRVLTEKAWRVAKAYPGVTVGLFRKVAASLPATTMRTFQRDVLDVRYLSSRNKTEGWFELTNGSRIYFMGLDPDPLTGVPSKVGSLDLGWAGVDEAVELTEGDWIMLLGRLRDPRMPWHQLAGATNPGPPNHWLKRRFGVGAPGLDYVHATAQDNRFLPDDYKASIANLPDNAIGRRLGRGEWVGAEGVIWALPDEQIRYSDTLDFKRVVAGLDWGFVHAFACEVIGQSGSGRLAVIDEVYERGADLENDIIPRLKELVARRGVTTFYADPSEPAYISKCVAAGLPVVSADNSVHVGLTSVMRAITAGMTISPECHGLLEEIPGYTWAQNRTGMQEKPIEINDDACDALRYGVLALDPTARAWGAGGSWGQS